MSNSAIDTNALKWIGSISKAASKFIDGIPVVKETLIDEYLQDSGTHLRSNAIKIDKKAVREFASISNPCTNVYVER